MEEKLEKDNSSQELTEEKLKEELIAEAERVAKEILERNEEERINRVLTVPSAIALSTTEHSAGETVTKVRKSVKQLFNLYLLNQFVARAINVRAETIVSKGYDIVGKDKRGVELCKTLIKDSGGKNFISQFAINTYIAGDGFLEKIYNQKKTRILRLKHVHPLTIGFKKDLKTDRIIIDKETKEPVGYVQYYVDENGVEREQDISKDVIAHHKFNSLGDEFTGLSLIQPAYSTIVRLMNMEYSAAEAAIRTANPLIVAICNTKSPSQIALWGQILGRINGREQIFVPQEMDIKFLSPGNQNFNEYADYFLDAVVAAFGVPKGVLLGGSGGGNRAESIVLTRHFYSSISSDQQSLQDFFDSIFEEYGKLAKFDPPRLIFGDVAEDAGTMSRAAIELYNSGIITVAEARQMIGLQPDVDGVLKKSVDVETDVKKSDMEQWHNNPGESPGSQVGEKRNNQFSPFSETKQFYD